MTGNGMEKKKREGWTIQQCHSESSAERVLGSAVFQELIKYLEWGMNYKHWHIFPGCKTKSWLRNVRGTWQHKGMGQGKSRPGSVRTDGRQCLVRRLIWWHIPNDVLSYALQIRKEKLEFLWMVLWLLDWPVVAKRGNISKEKCRKK